MQIDYLAAQKHQLTTCLTRGQMVEASAAVEGLMLAENSQTLIDQNKCADTALSAVVTAHGILYYKCATPAQMPPSKEYLKKQLDETTTHDYVHKQRLTRAVEKAQRETQRWRDPSLGRQRS